MACGLAWWDRSFVIDKDWRAKLYKYDTKALRKRVETAALFPHNSEVIHRELMAEDQKRSRFW